MIPTAADNAFDRMPLDSPPHAALRPDQLALTSWLHGGPVPQTRGYRYLDLGCGGAVSLVPLAYYNPDANFVGIDISVSQIDAARAAAKQLDLKNLKLEVADARDLSIDLDGPFDYVVANEVLPWIDRSAGSRVLATCHAQLAPNGLCCVSINVQPGWAVRGLFRDQLRRAVEGIEEPEARIESAVAFARWFTGTIPADSGHPFHQLLASELEMFARSTPVQIYHYYLSGDGTVYSHGEFAAQAEQHGLSYVGEATFNQAEGMPREMMRTTVQAGGVSGPALEELLDLVSCSSSRTSILCATDAQRRPVLDGPGLAAAEVSVASALAPESSSISLEPRVEVVFGRGEARLSFATPLVKAALVILAQRFPAGVKIPEVFDDAGALLYAADIAGADTEAQQREVLDTLVSLHRNGLVELRLREPNLAGVDPAAQGIRSHPLACLEAVRYPWLTTPLQGPLPANDFVLLVAARLKPGWQRPALIEELVESVIAGQPPLEIDGEPATDAEQLRPVVDEMLGSALAALAAWGLLSEA